MTDTLTPGHEPSIQRVPRPGHPYTYLWSCLCGKRTRQRCTSKPVALLDYYRAHFPSHQEPPHFITVVPAQLYAETWKCSCGESGDPAGYTAPIRVQQSHTAHTNRLLLAHYEGLVQRSMARWTPEQKTEHRRALWQHQQDEEARRMDRVMAERQRLIQERLDELL